MNLLRPAQPWMGWLVINLCLMDLSNWALLALTLAQVILVKPKRLYGVKCALFTGEGLAAPWVKISSSYNCTNLQIVAMEMKHLATV